MKNLTSKFAKTIFISVLIFFGLTEANAQGPALNTNNYRTAIGLRAGGTSGLTIKHFMTPNHAIEGIIGAWPNAINLTGLFEWHVATPGAPGLKWYYGIGAHATVYRDRYFYYRENPNGNRYRYYRVRENGVGLGIDGIFGLEYKIKPIPLALSLDLKPYLEIGSNNVVYSSFDPGLGLKFTF